MLSARLRCWWSCGESNPGPTVRAQDFSGCSSLASFSAPVSHANKDTDGLSYLKVPPAPVTRVGSSGSLDDARIRDGSTPGLTDFEARSGGEGEVGASVIGTYWFTRSVLEMTVHPLPASPGTTTVVETDQPLCSFSRPEPGTQF